MENVKVVGDSARLSGNSKKELVDKDSTGKNLEMQDQMQEMLQVAGGDVSDPVYASYARSPFLAKNQLNKFNQLFAAFCDTVKRKD